MTRFAPLALVFTLVPAGLAGQGLTVAPYVAADGGLAGAPALVGLSLTRWTGPLGLRVGGAVDVPSSPIAPLVRQRRENDIEAWQSDLDLVLDLGRLGLRPRNIEPRVFAGVGIHGRQQPDGSGGKGGVWTYGAGAAVPLTRWLAVDLEARRRLPHESDPARRPAGVDGGWDARAGLALRFGGARSPAPRPAPSPGRPGTIYMGAATRDASAAAVASSAVRTAERFVGTPYVWGGNSPGEGFDCSGFVRYVFAEQGIQLPRVARDQASAGKPIPPRVENLAPGDLMFYADRNGVIDHVAIYAGDGRIIHASSSGRGVTWDDLNTPRGRYYATRMVEARRVIPDGGTFRLP